jgi:regulation of enolase protein 1 (concanavalin A-like superfamily)
MNLDGFKWLNESKISVDGERIVIDAPGLRDFFNNPVPEGGEFNVPQGNAPFFYTDVDGDFVIRVKVKPNFETIYDAACIMVIQDENLWIKAAYEKSDFDTTAVVSVVTNKVSDDANGCNLTADSVWLQVARVGCNFAVHYSLDGEKFDMVRLCYLPVGNTVKVGIEAQCPTGQGGVREFSGLSIEKRSIADLRAGK